MKTIHWWLTLWLLIPSLFLEGQADTVLYIETIEVAATKIREQATGGQSLNWNTETLKNLGANNLADLLSNESNIFIKSYGRNSLATSSIRGGSAGHTLVLWNGLPIHSPTLGLLDLSLLPTNVAEEVNLRKGGNAALWGSGAIGGVLSLNNQANFKNRKSLAINTSFGAFGEWLQQVQLGLGNQKFQSTTKVFHHQAENDFFYNIAPGFPKRQQTNASFSQQNFLQDIYWSPKKSHKLSLHFWKQKSDREIPPLNTQNVSQAHQSDQANRLMFNWQHIKDRYILNTRIGYFNEKLDYFDDQIGLEANSKFTTMTLDINSQWTFSDHNRLSIGLTQNYTEAQTDGYNDPAKDHRSSLFASYRFDKQKLRLQASIRQELASGKFTPFIPILGFNYQLKPYLGIKGKISKNYRLPTLNDRFWFPGGNENLLAESGWSEELSLVSEIEKGPSKISVSITAFNRNIDNWILWSIREGQSFWSANNIAKVWSRGLEPRFSYVFNKNKYSLQLNLAYDYIRSTNEVALQNPKIDKGVQLLYVPVHQAAANLSIGYGNLHINYQQQYKGASQGSKEAVDAFMIGNLRLQYHLNFGIYNSKIFFNINNIWNADYFVIERRPMPGRYWQTGIQINLTTN